MTLTYGQFLAVFVIFPTICLFFSIASSSKTSKKELLWVGVVAFIAFVWTPIWDNYLVSNKIWWYDDNLVWNIIIGFVPLEEYCFFVLQPLFGGILLIYCIQKQDFKYSNTKSADKIAYGTIIKIISILFVGSIWSISVYYFMYYYGKEEYFKYTYLMLIIVWSFPPLIIQLVFAGDILFKHIKLLSFVIISSTIYLSLADCIAIYIGIWTIAETKSIGNIGPILPFEEAFFFFITNVLCVCASSFYLLPESRCRMNKVIKYFKGTNKKYE
eukprot:170449_1